MEEKPIYNVVLSETSFQQIISYKNALLLGSVTPGGYLKKSLDTLVENFEQISNEKFIELLLSTKKPIIFAENDVKCDGSDWNRIELQILGNTNITMPVEVYDNGVWDPLDRNFHQHIPPFNAELLFSPGALLHSFSMKEMTPDFEEITTNENIDQDKYNKLIDRRLTPLLFYANENAKNINKFALITVPGIGCGQFAGKFRGKLKNLLNESLQYIIKKNSKYYTNISCIYYDPFNECRNDEKFINGIQYRVRPALENLGKSQLCKPIDYQELGDDFTNCKLFKIVAWDHVSYPGNDYFIGKRNTDDGVAAAATNSMEIVTGIKGKYKRGYYMPPEDKKNWQQIVLENNIRLKVRNNVKIITSNGMCVDLTDFEKNN